MQLYIIDVTVHATAYIQANSAEDARSKAKAMLKDTSLEVDGDERISGARFDDPNLPEVSLSPAMTIGDIGKDAWEAE